jgi:FeS assembly protein SufB
MATEARDLTPEAPERINPVPENVDLGGYKYGWHDPVNSVFTPKRGLSHDVVEEISAMKQEPEWMRKFRHKSLDHFLRRPMPQWGGDLNQIDFDNIFYFLRATEKQATSWDELPADIKNTYDRLGIPEAEKQRLIAGVAAQYECIGSDSRIWTANRGMVRIKEIEPGDRVFALDEDTGRLVVAPVKGSAQTDVRQTYEVRVGTRSIRATDNHPVLVLEHVRKTGLLRSRYRRTWKTVGELRVGDLVAVPRGLPEFGVSHQLPPIVDRSGRTRAPAETSVDLLWLLGYFLGDGSLRSAGRTHRVQFAVPDRDPDLRAEITRIVNELFGVPAIAADAQRLVVNSRPLVDWLHKLGFVGTALTKQVPAWVFGLPTDQRLSFLGGWVDADGYIPPAPASGSIRLTSGNQPLLEQAAELAALCGLRTSKANRFTSRHPFDAGRRIVGFRLGITGDFERLDCRNPRRTDRFGRRRYFHSNTSDGNVSLRAHITEHLGFAWVTSITPADVEPVYDIEVDGPHNFVAEGLIVHNSEVVYHKVREDLEEQGVLFLDTDTALKEHEELFREHWATVIPANDNKFAALNSAVWSGGSFIWIPEGVHVEIPLQAYFRINSQNMGQFERTLIIAEPGSSVHYVEGCTAPIYSSDSLHSAVVEIIVKPHAKVRYTTIQNWSTNVYNLVTKRAAAYEGATMEWIDGNIGSKLTMKYPAVLLLGEHAHGEILSVAFAGNGQHQDAGAKLTFAAPNTTGQIVSKSISRDGGRTSYRGLVKVEEDSPGVKVNVRCDALLLDEESRSDTYPYTDVKEEDVTLGHEATVSKIGDDQLFYLQSRGLSEAEATAMIVRGFIEPISKELPMEYALELNRLIALQMEGAVG